MSDSSSSNVPYITTIENVQEVILVGSADLDFWRAQLQRENLFPFIANGAAQILMSGTQFKWGGLDVRERVISIAICKHAEENPPDGAYLIRAFNSSRVLAFAERAIFQTPYDWGNTEIDPRVPASIRFADGADALLRAQMSGIPPRLRDEDELMQGAVYLPGAQNVFFAKLSGCTEADSFAAGADQLEMRGAVFQSLIESPGSRRASGASARTQHTRDQKRIGAPPRDRFNNWMQMSADKIKISV